jgi:hypothetical protein
MVAAVAEEAGQELVKAARDPESRSAARSAEKWRRTREYLEQLAGWLGRDDLRRGLRRSSRTTRDAVLHGFAELMGESWPPLIEARGRSLSGPRSP